MQTSAVRSSIRSFSPKCYFQTMWQQEWKHHLSPNLNVATDATL